MASPAVTEDYYSTLGLDQTATLELITRAYRRLALKLHPDRGGSTQAFQLLGRAYETLNDENKRRAYDQIYSSIGRSRTNPQRNPGTQTPRPSPAPASQSDMRSDDDLLAALRKENEVHSAQWRVKRESLMPPIIALQRSIRVLEQEVKDLSDAAVAEAAVKARKKNKNLTASDLLSALSIDDDEDEKTRSDRRRRHREIRTKIESKEWDLGLQEAVLQERQKVLDRAKEFFDAANLINDRKIQDIEARSHHRKAQEQKAREREKREQEKRQNFMRQAREAQEAARRRQAEKQRSRQAMREQLAKAQKVRDDAQRARDDAQRVRDDEQRARDHAQRVRDEAQKARDDAQKARDTARKARDDDRRVRVAAQRVRDNARRARQKAREELAAEQARQEEQERLQSACGHGGWWDKVHDHTACPECHGVWSFLLKCPDCHLQVCPRCQLSLRPKVRRNTAKADPNSD
jgi:curved DNA-binding protein CbpA